MKKAGVGVENHSIPDAVCGCQAGLKDLVFCAACGQIQPEEFASPFDYFDLEEVFFVDLDRLRQHYLHMQNLLHPDRFIKASPDIRTLVARHAAALNTAYGVLRDPLKRATYLLRNVPDAVSPEVLAVQMERQETVMALTTPEDLDALARTVQKDTALAFDHIDAAFLRGDLAAAKLYLIEIRYLTRLSHEILAKMDKA